MHFPEYRRAVPEPRQDYRLLGLFSFRGVAQMFSGCRAISSYWSTQIGQSTILAVRVADRRRCRWGRSYNNR